ncbi:MAG: T9SS type A sorting domain-containing protein, partial [Bacteroidota bacterium]
GGGDDKEHELSITPTLNGWNHISVPISAFTGLTTKANIAQLIFASVPSGSSIVYIDNVLFSKNMQTSLSSAYPERVGIYPNPVKNILNINAKNTIQHVVIYNSLGQVVSNSTPETLDLVMQLTDLPNGVYFVQVTVNGVDTFSKISKE